MVLKKLIYFHLIPLAIACLAIILFVQLNKAPFNFTKTVSGKQTKLRGSYSNLQSGELAELNYVASIQNKKQLTIFGSSEFNNSPLCPYHFFPDSLGLQMIGIGHAFHQSLSMLIELMAVNDYLDSNNNLCFIISPGWFAQKGTNTEAFIEFAKPNFLKTIASNHEIPAEFKLEIGKYISRNQNDLDGISPAMEVLKNQYLISKSNILSSFKAFVFNLCQKKLSFAHNPSKTNYELTIKNLNNKEWHNDFESIGLLAKEEFFNLSSNQFYVLDSYYKEFMKKEDEPFELRVEDRIELNTNLEYQQHKTLLRYLRYKKVNASFIILPLNPYCFQNLEINEKFFETLALNIEAAGFKCYNMYVSDTSSYDKGILKDMMHLSDFGWMKVNKFIFETHYETTR